MCIQGKKQENRESGAVVVEAVISMTTFMFAILIILSVVDIAYIQSKMAVALNSSAKEISQYCFLYYKFQLDKANAALSEDTEDAQNTVEDTVAGLGQMMDSFGGAGSDFEEGKFDSAIEKLKNGAGAANQTIAQLADQVAEDPKAFIVGMAKLAGRELVESGKVFLGQVMARAFMAKNLKSFEGDEPDAFLRRFHVVNGMSGLDFQYTSLMAYGASNEIRLVCTYKVKVIQLLNIDFEFTFRQSAVTTAWGNGVSLVQPWSIWTSMAPMARGSYIVEKEKEGYLYTSSGQGFDAYVNSGGKNEFVTITSMDPSSKSYQEAGQIKNRLDKEFSNMYAHVSALDSSVAVKQNNQETTVNSVPETRTYRIVLILPEETDAAYKAEVVNTAISQLKAKYPNESISVEVKEGYGNIPKKESESEGEND